MAYTTEHASLRTLGFYLFHNIPLTSLKKDRLPLHNKLLKSSNRARPLRSVPESDKPLADRSPIEWRFEEPVRWRRWGAELR